MKPLTQAEISTITLADIKRMKAEIRTELGRQKEHFTAMKSAYSLPSIGKGGGRFMQRLRIGYFVFSGAMTGLKVIRTLRRAFR